MKKLGKTTRAFRYDIYQIHYSYAVEVINRFKRLDLVDGVTEELWTMVHNIVKGAVTKTISKWGEKNARRQNSCLRRLYK